jgi:hypothetical protein
MSAVQRLSRISLMCREPERLGCFYERAFGFVRSKQSEMGGTALESLLRIPGAEAKIISPLPIQSCHFAHGFG